LTHASAMAYRLSTVNSKYGLSLYKIAADKRCSLPTKLSAALYMDQPLRLNTSQA
jgi:hypothetical protein